MSFKFWTFRIIGYRDFFYQSMLPEIGIDEMVPDIHEIYWVFTRQTTTGLEKLSGP